MESCSLNFSNIALFLLAVIACSVSSTHSYKFTVGWTTNPTEGYNQWAERNRFQVNDTLYFKYDTNMNSVLVVNQEDYNNCNPNNPLARFEGGESEFQFPISGPFYFITRNVTNCQKGQKLIVVVLAVRSPPPPPPPAKPSTPPSPQPPSSPVSQAASPAEVATPTSSTSHPTLKNAGVAMMGPAAVMVSAVTVVLGLMVINY